MTRSTLQSKAQSNGHVPSNNVSLTKTSAKIERDAFDSEEFEESRESLPYLQMLNHQAPEQSGFFITLENAEAIHFSPNEEWTLHTETF